MNIEKMRDLREEYMRRVGVMGRIKERFKAAVGIPLNEWRFVWDQDDGEDEGGWIATNGMMFMSPTALKELAPDIYQRCMAEAGLQEATNE